MKMAEFFKQVQNTVEKVDFSPFPKVFTKDLYCRHVKSSLFGKGLNDTLSYKTELVIRINSEPV